MLDLEGAKHLQTFFYPRIANFHEIFPPGWQSQTENIQVKTNVMVMEQKIAWTKDG